MSIRKLTHAEISENRIPLERIHERRIFPVTVVLHSIRSTYNVGSIFRSSDGSAIEKLFLCGFTPEPPKRDILKTALGATESVAWEARVNTLEVLREQKSRGYKIISLEQTSRSIPYYSVPADDFPMCLVIGNEINGVPQELLDECDGAIDIPQFGMKQSLNVAVAYGIAVFELRRIFEQSAKEKL